MQTNENKPGIGQPRQAPICVQSSSAVAFPSLSAVWIGFKGYTSAQTHKRQSVAEAWHSRIPSAALGAENEEPISLMDGDLRALLAANSEGMC